jgi:cell division septation protein DedD
MTTTSSQEQDTEITLGTAKLLVLFFGLVAICAVFFALGYSLGRKAEPGIATVSAPASPQATTSGAKPAGNTAPPMTFYKAVEQKEANPELTPPPSDVKTDSAANAASPASTATPATQPPANNPPDSTITIPTSAYNVQVAAVSKQEDADALVDALKKKQYQAFVAPATADKLFRVQVGPFTDIKDAEATRARLISDGYNPIVKK